MDVYCYVILVQFEFNPRASSFGSRNSVCLVLAVNFNDFSSHVELCLVGCAGNIRNANVTLNYHW